MRTTLRRPLALFAVFAVAASWFASPAGAQSNSDTGIIQITVQSAGGKLPLADAGVFLLGPTVARALTTKSGIVKYTDVPSGIYRVRVSKNGFQGSTSASFEVLGNKEIDVEVFLGENKPSGTSVSTSDGGPAIIGRVQARVSVSTHDVDENSAIRKISDSLTDALNTIAGVDVTQDSNDPNAPQTISLRGQDETQTAVTLDGIPLGAPGSAVNLRSVNTDLFSGASASFGPQAGALAGSVNFRTLQPTQTWQSRISTGYGTFDKFTYQIGETGSIGKLGIALLHTDRQGNSPLTFRNYLDASGIAYPHDGENANRGDFIKLRYGLSDRTTLNFTALQNNAATSQVCTQFVTLEPCGIGPYNDSSGKFQFVYGSIQTLVGETAISATAYVNSNTAFVNDADRLIDLQPSPLTSRQSTLARGLAFSATTSKNKHTVTFNGSTYASTTTFNVSSTSSFVLPSTNTVASRQFQFSDSYKSNDHLTLGLNASVAGTSGAGTSFVGGLTAAWRPTASDIFSAGISVGSSQPAAGIVRSFSDPSSARVNCAAGTATVSGPGDQNEPQSSVNYQASWTHQWKSAQLTVDGYRQSQNGQLINALLTGSTAGLPAGYADQIFQYYAQPTVCGAAVSVPTIYVNEFVGNTARIYQGFDVVARIGLGPNVVLIPSYSTTSAVITAADQRLLNASSTTIIGAQIPGRPLHKANFTVDANEPRTGTEFLANLSYVGNDNQQHLTPYALVNVGLSHQVGIGRLTVFASNLFNTEAGDFSTLQYAQPIPLSGGGYLLTAANPNPLRQYTVTYSFNTGALRGAGFARPRAGVPGSGATAAARGASATANEAGGGAPNQLRGRFRFEPPPAGVDPLSLATSRESCPADAQPKAQAVVDAIKAQVAAVKAGQKPGEVAGFTPTVHGDPNGDAWFLELRPGFGGGRGGAAAGAAGRAGAPGGFGRAGTERGGPEGPGGFGEPPPVAGPGPVVVQPRNQDGTNPQPRPSLPPEVRERLETFRAFVGCAYITALKPSEAKEKHLDVNGPSFGYAPPIGLFFVQPPELGTGGGSVKQ